MPIAVLTPPGMDITKDGFHLVIELEDLGPQFEFLVVYWRREPSAKVRFRPWPLSQASGKESQTSEGWVRKASPCSAHCLEVA